MASYRCPKHDKMFDSFTDHRAPGSPAVGHFLAHPHDGHPDCPLCQSDAVTAVTGSSVTQGEGRRASNV
jgi:hypothetical protein